MSDDPVLAAIAALTSQITALRGDLMARIDRLFDSLSSQVSAMERQIRRLQSDIAGLKGEG